MFQNKGILDKAPIQAYFMKFLLQMNHQPVNRILYFLNYAPYIMMWAPSFKPEIFIEYFQLSNAYRKI